MKVRPPKYPSGTDLHRLWGWAQRLEAYSSREIPSRLSWTMFRPDSDAADAVSAFTLDYGPLVEEIRKQLATVEEAFAALKSAPGEQREAALAERMQILSRKVFKVCDVVAERSGVQPVELLSFDEFERRRKRPTAPAFAPPEAAMSTELSAPKRPQAPSVGIFPYGEPSNPELVSSILHLLKSRDGKQADFDLLLPEFAGDVAMTENMLKEIRRSRSEGVHLLPPNQKRRAKRP